MHTIELLEQAVTAAEQLGYHVRHEWLGGSGGGACEFAGQKWLFIDLALNAVEQLELVRKSLTADPGVHSLDVSPPLKKLLGIRRSA
jgi:hypothetical protein